MTTTTLRRWATTVTVNPDQTKADQLRTAQGTCWRPALITVSGLEGREIVTSQIGSL